MRLPSTSPLLVLAALSNIALAASGDAEKTTTASAVPCTASSSSGAFYDLTKDVARAEEEGSKHHKGAVIEDYHARGWDYGANFTLNLCAPVVKPVKDVYGVDKAMWKNVSAYYQSKGKIYSLGGSPCGPSDKGKREAAIREGAQYKHYVGDEPDVRIPSTPSQKSKSLDKTPSKHHSSDDEDDEDDDLSPSKPSRRKSLTISFLCDRDPMNTVAAASFVSADPDECAYFFEVRSQHACAGAEPHKPGSVGPASVFAIIFVIAVLVYIVGGVMYQRTVAHARGWRQLPNYSLWSGIFGFVGDFVIILTSSCARFLPSRRGYRSLNVSPNGRSRNRDDENRLIDQLDEEWDD